MKGCIIVNLHWDVNLDDGESLFEFLFPLPELDPVFRTTRKGGILHQEVSEWQHDDVGLTSSLSSMR
jgi:hypothetical protein